MNSVHVRGRNALISREVSFDMFVEPIAFGTVVRLIKATCRRTRIDVLRFHLSGKALDVPLTLWPYGR